MTDRNIKLVVKFTGDQGRRVRELALRLGMPEENLPEFADELSAILDDFDVEVYNQKSDEATLSE